MTLDERMNPSLRELGSGSAARTASMAADSMVTYMGVTEMDKSNGVVVTNSVPETTAEDDEFLLSTDIDALFFASASGSSNDGGSDKLSLGDEDENAIKSNKHESAVPVAGTGSTAKSTLVQPTYGETQTQKGPLPINIKDVPQYVGPTTKASANKVKKMGASETDIGSLHKSLGQSVCQAPNEQHLVSKPTTGNAFMPQNALSHSSGYGGIHNIIAPQPWLSIGSFLQQQNSSQTLTTQGMGTMFSNIAPPSSINLSTKPSFFQNPSSSNTRKRNRESSSTQDPNSLMTTMIKSDSTVSSATSADQNLIPESKHETKQRRKDRNLREQIRSQQITHQIAELKDLLMTSSIPCKPDKFSTLTSVYKYIKDLHERKSQLDEELRYLLETINQTNNLVNVSQGLPNTQVAHQPGKSSEGQPDIISSSSIAPSHKNASTMSAVESLDYQTVFSYASVPLAVIHLDGRLIDCNVAFANLFAITRMDVGLSSSHGSWDISSVKNAPTNIRISLFHLLAPYDMNSLFVAMSNMLENSARLFQSRPSAGCSSTVVTITTETGAGAGFDGAHDYWSGIIHPLDKLKTPVRIA